MPSQFISDLAKEIAKQNVLAQQEEEKIKADEEKARKEAQEKEAKTKEARYKKELEIKEQEELSRKIKNTFIVWGVIIGIPTLSLLAINIDKKARIEEGLNPKQNTAEIERNNTFAQHYGKQSAILGRLREGVELELHNCSEITKNAATKKVQVEGWGLINGSAITSKTDVYAIRNGTQKDTIRIVIPEKASQNKDIAKDGWEVCSGEVAIDQFALKPGPSIPQSYPDQKKLLKDFLNKNAKNP